MKVFIDLVLIAILVACIWGGYKKGLIMGVGGILVIIISIYLANLVSATFSYEVIPALRPFVSGYMEPKIEACVYEENGFVADELGNYNTDISSEDLILQNPGKINDICEGAIQSLGIYGGTSEIMAAEAADRAAETGASISDTIIEVTCEKITYFMGFILAFTIILIVLTVIGNLFNLSFKLPGLNIVNDIGGVVLGLITGALFCSILVWTIKFAGIVIHEETLVNSPIASIFLKLDILTKYLGI